MRSRRKRRRRLLIGCHTAVFAAAAVASTDTALYTADVDSTDTVLLTAGVCCVLCCRCVRVCCGVLLCVVVQLFTATVADEVVVDGAAHRHPWVFQGVVLSRSIWAAAPVTAGSADAEGLSKMLLPFFFVAL